LQSAIARGLRRLPGGSKLVSLAKKALGDGYPPDNQWLRTVMNRETRKLVNALSPGNLEVLEISGDTWNIKGYFKEYMSVCYPEYDVCERALERSFDLIIAEQVFEHLLWPYRAAKHIHQMLRPGRHVLLTVPFMLRIHGRLHDCTRWSETGLKYFLAECGFSLDRIHTQSWGNRACVKANFGKWQVYQPWRHSLANEPKFPVMVWALEQK
jgi:hypothetical protein